MNTHLNSRTVSAGIAFAVVALNAVYAQDPPPSSYSPVVMKESFTAVKERMTGAKAEIMQRHKALLDERYDLADRPAEGVMMSAGRKAVQAGVRVKLPEGATWDDLAGMAPGEVREKGLWPSGFYPLPHPNHPEGGMLFPQFVIDEIKKQEARDLTRFDLDYDLPDHFLPEFPAPIYLTTRTDLGDVSQGKAVTIMNYFELFNGILNPKQLEGLRLLVTPFPQQQFNQTDDRRSAESSRGVACFDCHANGHADGATHLVGDIRPQEFRHRLDTPTLRGVNIQRLFGSQRALKSIEDFTEFEQR
ncbi:cytochrome B6, partial [bacterium]|nr:cytochrome B6 [bacterium]